MPNLSSLRAPLALSILSVLTLVPAQIAFGWPPDEYCMIKWIETPHTIPQEYIHDCEMLCDPNSNYSPPCITWEHPDCPGCEIRICFISNSWTCKDYSCGYMSTFGQIMLECGREYRATDLCWKTGDGVICRCSEPFPCLLCPYPWPQEVQDEIDDYLARWEAGVPIVTDRHLFKCDCDADDCLDLL